MTSAQWQQVKKVLEAVLELEPAQHSAYLDKACFNNPTLRREVESLLRSNDEVGNFLNTSFVHDVFHIDPFEHVESRVGHRIGPYELIEKIAQGGMGAVYRAIRVDDQYQKQVAIKLVNTGFDAGFTLPRFKAERQILANLEHPNIARLLDGGAAEQDLPYFVMELVEGQPIDQYCDSHNLSVLERLRLFRTVCSAVQYAHQNLVIHRDLKPANIMVTPEGVPKLLDFGIAKILAPESFPQKVEPTAGILRLFTPEYASPEQVRGEPISTVSDVYSLGVVLYRLLTGWHPYELSGDSPQLVLQAICEIQPVKPSLVIRQMKAMVGAHSEGQHALTPEIVSLSRNTKPEKLRRQLAGDLDNIVLMALRKEPLRRYASIEQFSEDIRRHLEGLPVIARTDTLGYRSSKFVLRHMAVVATVALVLLTAVTGGLLANQQRMEAERQRSIAESRALAAQAGQLQSRDPGSALDLALRGWRTAKTREANIAVASAWPQLLTTLRHDNQVWQVEFSPDGQRLLTASLDNTARIWNASNGQLLAILRHDGEVIQAIFSPDGQRILTASLDKTARVWNAANGQLLLKLQHDDQVAQAMFSPDGRHIVTASLDKTARMWNAASGQLLVTFQHNEAVAHASFSADNQRVLTASLDHSARVWNAASGQLLLTLKHQAEVWQATFSPDGRQIVTASDDKTARVWNSTNGQLLTTLVHDGEVWQATFSPDGRHILTASADKTARVWNSANGQLLARFTHDAPVNQATFSPDGRHILTASADKTAAVWSVASGQLLATLTHDASVRQAAFSLDGQRIATASADKTVRLWSAVSSQVLATLLGDSEIGAAFSPNSQRVVTASADNTVRVWNASNGQLLTTLTHPYDLRQVTFSPDSERILVASADKMVRLWNSADGQLLASFGHDHDVRQAVFSADGHRILTISVDKTARVVRMWSAVTDQLLVTFMHDKVLFPGPLYAELSPDGQLVVTLDKEKGARVWSTANGQLLTSLTLDPEVLVASFSPNGQRILTVGADAKRRVARVWSAGSGQLLATLAPDDQVWQATFSPDGLLILTANLDAAGSMRVWNSSNGQRLVTLATSEVPQPVLSTASQYILASGINKAGPVAQAWNAPRRPTTATQAPVQVHPATFSPDSRHILTIDQDKAARVWNVSDGQLLATLRHDDQVGQAIFSPNGQLILTVSLDRGMARVWDANSGQLLAALKQDGQVTEAVFSPDGQRILATSENTARVFRLITLPDIERELAK